MWEEIQENEMGMGKCYMGKDKRERWAKEGEGCYEKQTFMTFLPLYIQQYRITSVEIKILENE